MTRHNPVYVDFSKIPSRTLLPEGDYHVKIVRGVLNEGASYPRILWTLEVTEGEFAGRTALNGTSLSPQSLGFLRQMLDAAKVPIPDADTDINTQDWVDEVVESAEEFEMTLDHEVYQGELRGKVRNCRLAEATHKPVKATATKAKPAPEPEPEEEDEDEVNFDEMTRDELLEFIDDNDLKVNATKIPSLARLRTAVQEAYEEKEEEEGSESKGNGTVYSEKDIEEMNTSALKKVVDDEGLDVDLTGTSRTKRRKVINALKRENKLVSV